MTSVKLQMWLQAVAIMLPRVQRHFAVSNELVGFLSTSMFGGMMVGALGWGTCTFRSCVQC